MYNPKNPKKDGKLNKPASLSYKDVKAISSELGLTMPCEHLAAYFAYSKARKSISYNEIYLIDSLYATDNKPAIKSFRSNDVFSSESYKDLIDKHSAVNEKDAPITISALINTSGEFVSKYTGYPAGETCQSTEKSKLSLYCQGCVESHSLPTFNLDNDKTFGIYNRIARNNDALPEGCSLIALLPATEMSIKDYEEKTADVMSAAESSCIISNPMIINERGVLEALIKLGTGACVNTSSYPTNPSCTTFASTLSAFAGYGAFLIAEKNKAKLLPLMENSNLVAIECARINAKDKITVTCNETPIAELDLGYLKSIKVHEYFDIISAPEYPESLSDINASLISLRSSASIVKNCNTQGAYVDLKNTVSGAVCDIDSYPMHNALYCALLPIFELVSKGANRQNIVLTKALEIKDFSNSDITNTALALHRVQTELALRDEANTVSYNSDASKLSVFARAEFETETKSPSDFFTLNGDGIYILSPEKITNGIPDFFNIRKLLDYVHGLIDKGVVKACRVFFNTPVETALKAMSSENAEAIIEAGTPEANIYFVVEATQAISGTRIGSVKGNTDSCEPQAENQPLVSANSDAKPKNTSVLLINYNFDRPELEAVIKTLSSQGAKIKYVKATLEKKCLEYLVSVIPDTQIIIFCGNDNLIANALCDISVQEALRAHRESKKLIIAFGEGAISALSDLHYLPQISSPAVDVILDSKCVNLNSKSIECAYSSAKISYTAKLSDNPKLIVGECDRALISITSDGTIFSDGIVSQDGVNIGVYSLLCDEIIESAIGYFN